jgi:nucleolar protein 56
MKTLYSLPFKLFVIENEDILDSVNLNEKEADNVLEGEFIKKEKDLIRKHKISKLVGFKKELPEAFQDLEISLSDKELERVSRLIDSNFDEFKQAAFSIFSSKMKKREHLDVVISNTIKAIDEADESINQLSKRTGELASEFLPSLFYHTQKETINYERLFSELYALDFESFNKKAEEDPLGKSLDEDSFQILRHMLESSLKSITLRSSLLESLKQLLKKYCNNLLEVLGPTIAARMIAEAGSLRRLAFLPSSTIQVLGAEKAFFKHLRSKTKCPKYGYIFQHQFIQKTLAKNRGKAARFLADKISLCARCDYFTKKEISDKVLQDMDRFRREP